MTATRTVTQIAQALRTLGANDWRTAGLLLDAAPLAMSRQTRDAVMARLGKLIRTDATSEEE